MKTMPLFTFPKFRILVATLSGLAILAGSASSALAATGKTNSTSADLRSRDLDFDTKVRAQDDFYDYVNGKWLATVKIPPDKSRYGTFYELIDKTESQLRGIVDGLAHDTSIKPDTDAQKIRDLYASFMDEARLQSLGSKPLAAQLSAIDHISNSQELATMFATLGKRGLNTPLTLFVHSDNHDSTHYAPDIYQAGLELPDRDYYLKDGDDGAYKKIRAAYRQHVANMFKLAGLSSPEAGADRVIKLETELAAAQWDKVANRDPVKTYNKYLLADLHKVSDKFAWPAFLQASGVSGKSDFLLLSQPSYVTEMAKLLDQASLEDWRLYLKWKVISGAAPYLSKAFEDESFAFNGKVLSGTPENRARWKRGLSLIESSIGEGLGKLYVQSYFPEENKQRIKALVDNLLAAYRQSIDQLDWMGPETKQQAQAKLAKIMVKIGYPDRWRDYSALQIDPHDLWGNVVRASEFEYQRQINKLGHPVDRTEWIMTPQTINAYYNPEMNEIVFPAAILQPPFFDMKADDAFNYGAIGAVIGHEISHAFDDQGSQYDGDGNLHNWWTAEDHQRFAAKTRMLIDQYSAYEPVPGYHLNGKLTLGENIADLSGLAIAFKAYQLSLHGKPAAVIDGLTGAQRFFVGWALDWREISRKEEAIKHVTTDPHSAPRFRVLGTITNMDAFYKAFNVKPGDKLYRPPAQRVSIW
ncbi:MAG: M13 family metallopeptidase [Steroidobacter sp.]